MTKDTKALVLQALSNLRGDDYERAKAAFRDLSPAEMQGFYGHSGKTRQQILEDYAWYAAKVDAAIKEIETL